MTNQLEIKRKRLLYQSWHRGCKETDIMLGRFAQTYLDKFDNEEIELYESFINEDDWNIFNWLTGKLPFPDEHENKVTQLLRAFDFSKQ